MKQQVTLPQYDWTEPYGIDIAYYREGFREFQKKYTLPRSYILMAFFALLLISFVYSAVQTPDNRMQYFLMMVCLAGIFILWYNPRKMRRRVLDALHELEGDRYISMCDGNVLRIQTVTQPDADVDLDEADSAEAGDARHIPETRILLDQAWMKEMPEFYLVCEGKRMFYIVPKRVLGGESPQTVHSDFTNA